MSYQSRKQKKPLEIEADLYTAVATMDKLSNYFDKGYVGETLYRRQLKACINDVYQATSALEKEGIDIDEFINRENLKEKFPNGLQRLDLADGISESSASISAEQLKKLPAKATDFVANAIELVDLIKLRSVAKVEYLVPLLDEMHNILEDFPTIGEDHWTIVEVNGWRAELLTEKPSKLLDEERAEKLEFDAARWLSDFRNQMKGL